MAPSKKISISDISPFFCIVTPVYDPTLEAVKLLIKALKNQTFGNFIHVMISNGKSKAIESYVNDINANDERFIYSELEYEDINEVEEILSNLGKRRNYVLKNFYAQRYLFADADLKIIREDYLEKLFNFHNETGKDIILTLVHYMLERQKRLITLPIFPIKKSCIDIANITISRLIAEKYGYPTDCVPNYDIANDYRLFHSASTEDNTIIMNFISAIKNGNNKYKSFMRIAYEKRMKK
jgi:hypothetical protein